MQVPVKSKGGAEPTSSGSAETKEFQTFRQRELRNRDKRMPDDDDLNFARKLLRIFYVRFDSLNISCAKCTELLLKFGDESFENNIWPVKWMLSRQREGIFRVSRH